MKKYIFSLLLIAVSKSFGQVCPPIDVPDFKFQDVNLDGMDGDSSKAIFVDSAFGNNANSGSKSAPVQTIAKGIELAVANAKSAVYVAKGTYIQSTTLQLKSGISLYGQFSGYPDWSRGSSNKTIISCANTTTMEAFGLSADTRVEGFKISRGAATNPSESVYAIRLLDNTGKIILNFNEIETGKAGDGNAGTDGATGDNGGNGSTGQAGSCDLGFTNSGGSGGASSCGNGGGAGGKGGMDDANGINGTTAIGGANGGGGGVWGDPGGDGKNGFPGADGSDGTNASSGTPWLLVADEYIPGSGLSGTDGTHGYGGGGGGGGGGQSCFACNDGTGNAGGGGGGGGCKGTAGSGGIGGGAAMAVYIKSTTVILANNTIRAGKGGNGGNGGNGGLGGAKGLGNLGGKVCLGEVGEGGNGGDGGKGGAGGSGSGGEGGLSIGVYNQSGGTVLTYANTFMTGGGGTGGSGGSNTALGAAASGSNGQSMDIEGSSNAWSPEVPKICIEDALVFEPANADSTLQLGLFLTSPALETVSVDYSMSDSSAKSAVDYTTASGSISFLAGEVVKQIPVKILHNSKGEEDRVFFVNLQNAVKADIAKGKSRIEITDRFAKVVAFQVGKDFCLLQNQPNPAAGSAQIRFVIPQSGGARVWITDVQGREIMDVLAAPLSRGDHEVAVNLQHIKPGIYFYHLHFGGRVLTAKMLVE